MLNELINGNYFIYQIGDGGCGIVKADNYEEALKNVEKAYSIHGEKNIVVELHKIMEDGWFNDSPDIIEIGWYIQCIN